MKLKKIVTIKVKKAQAYKVGDLLLVKKAPESLKYLVGLNVTVAEVNKFNLVLNPEKLVVSFNMIKKEIYEFAKKRKPKATT